MLSTPGSRDGILSSLDLEELGCSSRYPKCSLLSINSFKIFPVYNWPSCIVHSYSPLNVCLCVCSVISNFCNTRDCSPPGSSVHGISQAGILEWVAISSSRGSFQPRDRTHVSSLVTPALAGGFFTHETPGKPQSYYTPVKKKSRTQSPRTR